MNGGATAIGWASPYSSGPFGNLPPTGKRFAVTGIDIFRIADGNLAEFWPSWSQLGLLQQLGALPASGW